MLVDLSHTISEGMPAYPGDAPTEVRRVELDRPWHVLRLALGTHSGTHIDAACHYVPGGRTIDEYPLERFVPDAWVVHLDSVAGEVISWAALDSRLPQSGRAGAAVLLHTGWDRYWGRPDAEHHPYLSVDAAQRLADAGVGLVGTDAFSLDATAGGTEHAHAALLGADVLIVENLTHLERLEGAGPYRCAFVPLRIEGGDGSPIRAYAYV
ncbi:MAG TPA: cyclase family protein [Thermoleophilia bacterium]|nr:cyclase family protein [Thermoleophilia bacterium]